MWLIIVIIFTYVIFSFIIKPMIGYFAPIESTGKLYLKEKLISHGINPKVIPELCIEEVVKWGSELARLKGYSLQMDSLGSLHNKLIHVLDLAAIMIRDAIKYSKEGRDPSHVNEEVYQILKTYKVINI